MKPHFHGLKLLNIPIFPRGSRSSGGFVTVVGFQEHFARWAQEHPEGASQWTTWRGLPQK